MLKKPSILFGTCSNLQSLCCPRTGLPSPGFPYQNLHTPNSSRIQKQKSRNYATVQPDEGKSDSWDGVSWPSASTSTTPSPYQIFHISPRDKYSKHRFYALVKLYHPDRSGHTQANVHIHNLPGNVKMERYRLIVAANDILSDPDKRKAYDCTGAGWNGRMEHRAHPSHYSWAHTSGEARWSGFDTNDSPFHNATWEDWERWYRRHEKQEPAYTSNGGFISLVALALVLGAVGQTGQVSRHEALFRQQVEVKHENATRTLLSHQQESQKAGHREQRLQKFMKDRDIGSPIGLGEKREERVETPLLPEPVLCMSDIQQKGAGRSKSRQNDDNG